MESIHDLGFFCYLDVSLNTTGSFLFILFLRRFVS